ncbi:MAG: HAMP domain-containing sensor histidine kinase [bacterium]|nr:HAMP domain-containing sensor histidine kinase [bacterium]
MTCTHYSGNRRPIIILFRKFPTAVFYYYATIKRMETNKHTLKSQINIERIGWLIGLALLLYLPNLYPAQFSKMTELAYTGLILSTALLYYYLAYNLLRITKSCYAKNIGDILFLNSLLFLAIQTKSYIALILIIPIAGSLLILNRINGLIVAASAIILVGLEIFVENNNNITLYFDPVYVLIVLAVIITFYMRILAQKAHYEHLVRQEEESKLAEINIKLSNLEHQGKEFTTLAARQISTPLATIQSFVQTLSSEKDGHLNDKQKVFIKETANYIEKMHGLISELLYITKVEFSPPPELRPMDILDTTKEVIKKFEPYLKEKNTEIKLKYPNNDMPNIKADKNYLPEILNRLIDNAIKYSPDKSPIEIVLQIVHKDNKPYLSLDISDRGLGIPNEEQKYLFHKFFRGSNIIDTEIPGNGLSLYVVKLLADKQNCKIDFKSKTDEGTSFLLDFPLEKSDAKKGGSSRQ